jgi:lactoylglutathione lyase
MPELLVNIDVDDLEKATTFYTKGFDLLVGRRFGEGVVELLGASAPIYLLAKAAGSAPFPRASSGRDYGRHWTPVHLDFVVSDLEVALAKAIAAGALVEAEPVKRRWGKLALLSDPFGHGLCLVQFENRGYDELLDTSIPAEVLELARRGSGLPAEAYEAPSHDRAGELQRGRRA